MDKRSLMALLVSIALFCAACGGSDEPTPAPTAPPAPTNTTVPPTNPPPPVAASQPVSPSQSITQPAAAAQAPITATESVTTTQPVSGANGAGESDEAYPAPVAAPVQQENAPYPPPSSNKTDADPYPSPVTPTPEPVGNVPVTPFVFQIPITTSATLVEGSGPPNVPILIVDASFMGDILGKGVIGADGKFAVEVQPLEEGHWIGVALDELKDTEFTFDDFHAQGFRGPGAEQIPQVGFIFDSFYVGDTDRR